MVKGVSRRVVVIKSPDLKFFEQAIFIVRDDALKAAPGGAEGVLREACRVADGYVRSNVHGGRVGSLKLPMLIYSGAGALAVAVAWALWALC